MVIVAYPHPPQTDRRITTRDAYTHSPNLQTNSPQRRAPILGSLDVAELRIVDCTLDEVTLETQHLQVYTLCR